MDDDAVARRRGDGHGGPPDRITDAVARHPFVAIPLVVAAMVIAGSVKVLSAEGSAIPIWLAVPALMLGVPLFVWMGWRVVLWLQRQRADDPTFHVSEQRPDDSTEGT